MSSDPWLSGLLACALTVDAEAVRAELKRRGLKSRSVPAGRAKAAWTCVTDRGTLAVVVSGKGAEAARQAASFWMPRARWLVLAAAGPGTGMAEPATVVLDGPEDLVAAAERATSTSTTTTRGRVATVADPVLGEASRQTLSQSGFAGWDAAADTWRQAAAAMGGVTLICLGITTNTPDQQPDLLQDVPDGATARPWWHWIPRVLSPRREERQKQADERHKRAVQAAAAAAVAALLGPA